MDEMNNSVPTTAQETTGSEATTQQNTQQLENTTPNTEQNSQQTQQESKAFKVKHLHEEKEISYDEAPTYIQKGLDYDRVKSKYEESKPTLSFVEELAQQSGMSVPEYINAVKEYNRQQEIEALQQQAQLPPELAEELYLSRQERQERESQRKQAEIQTKQNQEYVDFMTEYPEIKPDSIPDEVWKMKAEKGISLTDAYIRYEHKQLKTKITAQETNTANAGASTGSLTGNGTSNDSFISKDIFNANKKDQRWVMNNLTKIMESRKKW